MMIVGEDSRGQALAIDPDQIACVVTEAMSTHTPNEYTIYLKSGSSLCVLLGEGNTLLSSFEGFLKYKAGV